MKKRVIAALLAGTMAMGILAGCGSPDAGGESTGEGNASAENDSKQDAEQEKESADHSDAGSEGESLYLHLLNLPISLQMGMRVQKSP